MALPAPLQTELRAILRQFSAAHSPATVPAAAGKALEAWLLMKIAQAANGHKQWRSSLRRGDGSRLAAGDEFRLPGGPSQIPAANPLAPGYVLLERIPHSSHPPDVSLELRGGVQWEGRSRAQHECDISVLPAEIADAIKNSGGGYPHGLPILAVECKDRADDGSIDEMRQMLARLFDLVLVTPPRHGPCRMFAPNRHSWGMRQENYINSFAIGTFGIARATGFQSGAITLGNHYHIKCYDNIYNTITGSCDDLIAHFLNTLDGIDAFT
jgi:hypothetical protein